MRTYILFGIWIALCTIAIELGHIRMAVTVIASPPPQHSGQVEKPHVNKQVVF